MFYFKMYAEFASDHKVLGMTEAMRWRLAALFCLRCAGPTEEMSETSIRNFLRLSKKQLADTKKVFFENGFIDDDWSVRNWGKRQSRAMTAAERMKKSRERAAAKKSADSDEVPVTKSDVVVAPLELKLLEREIPPTPLYSDEIESEPPKHPAFDYRPTVVDGQPPKERSGSDKDDWDEAVRVLESAPSTKPIAIGMTSLSGTPTVELLEGWRFLHAAHKVQRPGSSVSWEYFLAIARRCNAAEFDRLKREMRGNSSSGPQRPPERPIVYFQAPEFSEVDRFDPMFAGSGQ